MHPSLMSSPRVVHRNSSICSLRSNPTTQGTQVENYILSSQCTVIYQHFLLIQALFNPFVKSSSHDIDFVSNLIPSFPLNYTFKGQNLLTCGQNTWQKIWSSPMYTCCMYTDVCGCKPTKIIWEQQWQQARINCAQTNIFDLKQQHEAMYGISC